MLQILMPQHLSSLYTLQLKHHQSGFELSATEISVIIYTPPSKPSSKYSTPHKRLMKAWTFQVSRKPPQTPIGIDLKPEGMPI